MNIKLVDLSGVTRNADVVQTRILVFPQYGNPIEWLLFGEINLRLDNNPPRLVAFGPELATDFEHDTIYIVSIPLLGVTLLDVFHGTTLLEAHVHPRSDDFHVPTDSSYNPLTAEGTHRCSRCVPSHPIVPEGFEVPPFNADLYEEVRGRKIHIHTGARLDLLTKE